MDFGWQKAETKARDDVGKTARREDARETAAPVSCDAQSLEWRERTAGV